METLSALPISQNDDRKSSADDQAFQSHSFNTGETMDSFDKVLNESHEDFQGFSINKPFGRGMSGYRQICQARLGSADEQAYADSMRELGKISNSVNQTLRACQQIERLYSAVDEPIPVDVLKKFRDKAITDVENLLKRIQRNINCS